MKKNDISDKLFYFLMMFFKPIYYLIYIPLFIISLTLVVSNIMDKNSSKVD